MRPNCPVCNGERIPSGIRPKIHRIGFFRRKSDSQRVQRYRCAGCKKNFSSATFSVCFRQKKRQFNRRVANLLAKRVSQRDVAKILNLSRTTVARKFCFEAKRAEVKLKKFNQSMPIAKEIEFDEMETFEHTKCKPISIILAVESKSRRILGFRVSSMPAKGRLAKRARKKYGLRIDGRPVAREELFTEIKTLIAADSLIKSDQNPHYPSDVKRFFPHASHKRLKGQRGSIVGQGELKKVRYDPLFSLNHTCAMLRDRINRLTRKTWSTTKKIERLKDHISIYAIFHNLALDLGP